MCGRISLFAELGDLAAQFRFALPGQTGDEYRPSWNIAPTAAILVIRAADGQRQASLMHWGFTFGSGSVSGRAGAGSSSRPLFNARSETLAERPAFRTAFAQRRCLVPANGFYEWRTNPEGGKTPMWIHRHDQEPFLLAGIYNERPNGAVSVITCEANALMSPIHNRMPALLSADESEAWLDPGADPDTLHALLMPRAWPDMTAVGVSRAVNRAANDGPHLIEPVDETAPDKSAPRLF